MKFIIDLDGPVLDSKKRLLQAYARVAGSLGREPCSEIAAWRLLRSGAAEGQLLRGAKPEELREFRRLFDEAIETDEYIALCEGQPEVGQALSRLKKSGDLILVTTGTNRFARQAVLDKLDLSVHFTRMQGLPADPSRRADQLQELADGDNRVVAACACEPLVRSAQQVGMVPVAVANGACEAIRLTRVGAQLVFDDLGKLANAVEQGCEKLIQAGLLPPQMSVTRNPFVEPDRLASGYRGATRTYNRTRR